MLRKIAFQILALSTVSILIGLLLSSFGVNLLIGILSGLFLQIVCFSAFNSLLTTFISLKLKKIENERLKELSFQSLEVTCPCYKKIVDFIPVKLNTSNYYKCKECNKNISIQVFSETAITTEPIATTDLPLINEEILKQIVSK